MFDPIDSLIKRDWLTLAQNRPIGMDYRPYANNLIINLSNQEIIDLSKESVKNMFTSISDYVTTLILFADNSWLVQNALNESYSAYFPVNGDSVLPCDTTKTSCSHSWKTYDSGWSKYDYCVHCDVKK